jgi:hypothetical protein
MGPHKILTTLTRRLNWLEARAAAHPEGARGYDAVEAEALRHVVAMLAALQGETGAELVAKRAEGLAVAKVRASEVAARCTCARCPVHGGQER